ncbi:MAG: DoxX family protein [Marmoricola sp.]
MKLAKLATRALVGGLFVGHGTQKLKGWFGGPGIEGTAGMMESLGLHPARSNAYAAGAAESAGGALLGLGLATPLASSALVGVMTTAIRKVHAPNGPWVSGGGWEYNAVLIAVALAFAETGPGEASLDHLFGTEKKGFGYALGAGALGVAGSFLTTELASRAAPPAPAAPGRPG